MNQKGLSVVLAILIICLVSASARAQKLNIIREGVGVEGITVGKSTKKDVEKRLGKNYKWIANGKYSYQMIYPNGLSFYFCQTEKNAQVFDIEIRSPYRAKTSRGITLRKSTLEDVYKIYGRAKKGLRYKGVEFYYLKQKGKSLVTVIDVVEKTGLRQCKENK